MAPSLFLMLAQQRVVDPDLSWGDRIMLSLTDAFASVLAVIPRILAFILILVIGWFVASLVARAVGGLLRTVNFNELARRSGISDFIRSMGTDSDASGFVAAVVKWFVRIIALVVAFDALGLPAVSDVLEELLLWLPNLVVAVVMLILGGLAANALANLVRGATAEADLGDPEMLATVTKGAVWAFAIIVAVNQLGIAETFINTLFTGFIAALAIALGLAFGLGGREAASEALQRWREEGRKAKPKMKQAARNMKDEADDAGPEITRTQSRPDQPR